MRLFSEAFHSEITEIQNTPILGGPAPRHAWRTAEKLASFALRHARSIQVAAACGAYLDVGCGNGFITERVSRAFDRTVGIDLEGERLQDFRRHIGEKPNFQILHMSAAKIEFPSESFDFVTCFEVLEHVPELDLSVSEIIRVCQPGGVIVISVPQVWFPFENHGARFGGHEYPHKVPLLPYIRRLHKRYSLARVFSSAEMDHLCMPKGLELLETGYAAPQFERAAARSNSWERKFIWLRQVLGRCESIPFLRALTGVSMLKAYRKGA